jgi:MFS family permease
MSYSESTNLVLLFNATGLPARLLTGWIADRFTGPMNGMIPLLLLNSICTFAWIGITSRASYYALVSIYGLPAGAFQCLFPTTLTCINRDAKKNGILLGMAFSVLSLSGLAGPPIGGALLLTNGAGKGGYVSALLASGFASLLGTCFMVVARVYSEGWDFGKKC